MADPGFSPDGCANSQIEIILQVFCRKLHENEWGGARPRHPLRSANVINKETTDNRAYLIVGQLHSSTNQLINIRGSGGSRISLMWGCQSSREAPIYNFAKFCPKLHEIERIWTPSGARPKFYYVDLPLRRDQEGKSMKCR